MQKQTYHHIIFEVSRLSNFHTIYFSITKKYHLKKQCSHQEFALESPRGPPFLISRGPVGAYEGKSYYRAMIRVENILQDFSVHFVQASLNRNPCNGGPSAIL